MSSIELERVDLADVLGMPSGALCAYDDHEQWGRMYALGDPNGFVSHLVFDGYPTPIDPLLWVRGVRWFNADHGVLFRSRSRDGSPNAFVVDRAGRLTQSLFIGDAASGLHVVNELLFVNYFDEGDGYHPSNQMAALLDLNGSVVWGLNANRQSTKLNYVTDCLSVTRNRISDEDAFLIFAQWGLGKYLLRFFPGTLTLEVLDDSLPRELFFLESFSRRDTSLVSLCYKRGSLWKVLPGAGPERHLSVGAPPSGITPLSDGRVGLLRADGMDIYQSVD